MKGFKLYGEKDGLISDSFNVAEQRADEMTTTFSKVMYDTVNNGKESFNACEIVEQFANIAQTENELHFALFCAGRSLSELAGPSNKDLFEELMAGMSKKN